MGVYSINGLVSFARQREDAVGLWGCEAMGLSVRVRFALCKPVIFKLLGQN